MRISTIQAFNNSVSGISRNYADLTRTQAEISAGKRLLTPADDPVGAVRLLQLNQEQALNSQYKSGITAAKNSLQQEETILNSVGTVIHRIREIAVQAGNGGLDASDKNALATELAQREDELLNLLNSRDASGKYLFSGSQGDTQPFVRNPDGTYSYNGDEGQREVQIASSTFIAISDNGKILFESGSNANRVSTGKDAAGPDASGNPSDSSISLGLVTDKEAYDTVFPSSTPPLASDGVGIHFTDAKNYVSTTSRRSRRATTGAPATPTRRASPRSPAARSTTTPRPATSSPSAASRYRSTASRRAATPSVSSASRTRKSAACSIPCRTCARPCSAPRTRRLETWLSATRWGWRSPTWTLRTRRSSRARDASARG